MNVDELRKKIDGIDRQVLLLLSDRGKLVVNIGEVNAVELARFFDPVREEEILEKLVKMNEGPYSSEDIKTIFHDIFRSSLALKTNHTQLSVLRFRHPDNTIVNIQGVNIGGNTPVVIAGPCSIESEEQLNRTADMLSRHGIKLLRGGAYKPRSSPYSFQGLGKEGLIYLQRVGREYNMVTVSEVMDPRQVSLMSEFVDILQIGARNMANYPLLSETGRSNHPVLLKRGMGATIEELLFAAEYILAEGNPNVILCERGIRTFETWSRFTLDVTAIAILRQKTHLPIIADVSHPAGQRSLVIPLARASLAAGANGIMVEVHESPETALSDKEQQLNFEQFSQLLEAILPFM